MTTQEDFAVENTDVDAATTSQAEELALNTQEDYDNLVLEAEKLRVERENYRKMALKYKEGSKSLDNDDDSEFKVKDSNSKSFTADEVADIATKAAQKALEEERTRTAEVLKSKDNMNAELKRSINGIAPTNGMNAGDSIDTTKTGTPYFSDKQKDFLKTMDVTEEEVLETIRKRQSFNMM